jgi:di/tricarboxylate transporter
VLTGLLGMFISNTATAVLVAPMAMGAAAQIGVSPYPLLMTVAVAASTSFATPVATPVNLLILGPGAYRFGDFARVGLLVQGAVLLVTVLIVPLLFPF